MKPNFKCNDCGHKIYVPEYTTVFGSSFVKYKDKEGRLFTCVKCQRHSFTFIAPKKGVPELMGAMNGTFRTEAELRKDKQQKRKLRAKHHFVNEVMDKHPDPHMRKHFQQKYKKWERKDHEKMK